MSFQSPLLLLTLLAIPLAILGWRQIQRRRMRYALVFTNVDVLAAVTERDSRWKRLVPPILLLLALTATCVATARPRVTVHGQRDQGAVVLLVDVSRSMVARDVKPSRLGAARQAIKLFLQRIPSSFSVGIVAFSDAPSVVSPVTDDRSVTAPAVDYLLPEFGTAIGDGLAEAVRVGQQAAHQISARRQAGRPVPVTILLLSDGAQRSGLLLPEQGAQKARSAGIRVYTIALGTSSGVVRANFDGFDRQIRVPPDPDTLRRISTITHGEFYPAPSANALKAAYRTIGSKVATTPRRVEIGGAFLAAGAVLLIGAGALSTLWGSRLP
jgi:Ca-activated chloride channel family protein